MNSNYSVNRTFTKIKEPEDRKLSFLKGHLSIGRKSEPPKLVRSPVYKTDLFLTNLQSVNDHKKERKSQTRLVSQGMISKMLFESPQAFLLAQRPNLQFASKQIRFEGNFMNDFK